MRSSLSEAFGLVVGTASGGPIHGMHGMHAVSDPSGVMHNRATSPHHTHAIGGTETGAGAGTGGDDSIGRFSVSAGRSSAGVEIL